MELIPATEFDLDLWAAAYEAAYNPDMAPRMGYDYVSLGVEPPSFVDFYDDWTSHIESGDLYAWGIIHDDELVGYMALIRTESMPEWEIATAISKPELWSRGWGVRAHIEVLRFAFGTLEAKWVWAISTNRVPEVESIMERGGYTRFAHIFLMRDDDFASRWGRRT